MIEPRQVPILKKNVEMLKTQLDLFKKRIKESAHIEPNGNKPDEEKARILALLNTQKGKLTAITREVEKTQTKSKSKEILPAKLIASLALIDRITHDLKSEVETLVEDQYECKLEVFKQEIFKSVDHVLESFDFIIPNIRHEIDLLEKHYRIPANAANTILPELEELIDDLENQKISLDEFIAGYGKGEQKTAGYSELRIRNKVFSKYQFYENLSESYKEINTCLYEIRKSLESFLSEKRTEPEFGKFFERFREMKTITVMKDIFELGALVNLVIKKIGKKYSYREEYKKAKPLADRFNQLQKSLVVYDEERILKTERIIGKRFKNEADQKKFQSIMDETKKHIKENQLPFNRIEIIFAKLRKGDFNIVVKEKDADDITIAITPHHEKKYGKNVLERINTIIREIDFSYPPEPKQLLFQDLAKTTEKIQKNQPVDKKEFFTLMQNYDKQIERNIRIKYPEKIKELNNVFAACQKTFALKMNREKLEKRLANKQVWNDIFPPLKSANKALMVLASGSASLKSHVNKFSFIKIASEELCQMLYDLSMQLFILYEGVDRKSITRMTDILSTYNEFSEVGSLWSAFSHYFKKSTITNLNVNEKMMLGLAKTDRSKAKLAELFPDDD